nr:flagellar hook-basal body complex protein [uncultured Romboutsia sp.]
MLRSMYASVSSMITLQARQGIITNNLANINTTGYKSETLVAKSFDDMLLYNKDSYSEGVSKVNELGSLNFGVRIDDTVTSYKQGALVSTENNTDFAIVGSGFFQVTDEQNNTYYTRDGSFKVNAQGYLVTNSGHYVMGTNSQNGNLERIYVGSDLITITSDNSIAINGENMYKFNIVDFENYDNLTKYGNNLYTGDGGFNSNNYNIQQKYLEGSNIDYINEMALMMETVKEFEANQRVIQTIDSTLSQIANEIGSIR